MFKKSSKRNLRQRKDSEEEAGGNLSANDVDVAALKAKQKKKTKEKKPPGILKSEKKAVLSFGGDDEEEESNVFQLKKSSRSRRIAKHIKKLAQEEREMSDTQGGNYTKERLDELKKLSAQPQSLGGSISPFRNLDNFSAKEPVEFDQFGSAVNGGVMDLRPGEIPDANHIHAARKQREMMRKYGGDYIPIENTETLKTNTKSRLLREDEGAEGSSEDEGPTVAMKGIIDDAERVAKEIGCDGEGTLNRDEEFDLWEAEMIKKGISTQQAGKWGGEEEQITGGSTLSNNSSYNINGTYEAVPSRTSVPETAMTAMETFTTVKKRISDRLECLQQVNRTHKQDAERTISDVKDSEESTVHLGNVTTLSKKYTYFQDMKAYIADLIDCLSEKNVEIEALEMRRHRIWKEKADMIVARRQQDVRDESSDITSALANVKITPAANDKEKQTRIREREARRSRRRSARERAGSARNHIDGTSTDEEATSMDKANWNAELDRIQKFKETLFEDVVDEFYDVKVILSKFEDWKGKYAESYNDAFIGLCLPKLLTPFVRLAILHWNPLEINCTPIEEMLWYQDLLFYGLDKDSEDCEATQGDPDTKVLSSIFDKVVLPKLTYLVREIWDPLSSTQSHRLSLLLCTLVRTYPCLRPDNRRCNELLLAICTRLQQSIDTDIFIPLYPTSALTNRLSGPGAYFERQTWACIKLYENILIFDGILSQDTLQELAFSLLLNRYIMLSLQTSPVTTVSVHKCQRIADAIPPHWFQSFQDVVSHLQAFSRYLLYIAKHIHGQLSACAVAEKRIAVNCIMQLCKILTHIGADDMSQDVMKLLGIKTLV